MNNSQNIGKDCLVCTDMCGIDAWQIVKDGEVHGPFCGQDHAEGWRSGKYLSYRERALMDKPNLVSLLAIHFSKDPYVEPSSFELLHAQSFIKYILSDISTLVQIPLIRDLVQNFVAKAAVGLRYDKNSDFKLIKTAEPWIDQLNNILDEESETLTDSRTLRQAIMTGSGYNIPPRDETEKRSQNYLAEGILEQVPGFDFEMTVDEYNEAINDWKIKKDCTCGFGGEHDDINPRCKINRAIND